MQIDIRVPSRLSMLLEDESGGTLMEYALIAALALVVCSLVVLAVRKISTAFA